MAVHSLAFTYFTIVALNGSFCFGLLIRTNSVSQKQRQESGSSEGLPAPSALLPAPSPSLSSVVPAPMLTSSATESLLSPVPSVQPSETPSIVTSVSNLAPDSSSSAIQSSPVPAPTPTIPSVSSTNSDGLSSVISATASTPSPSFTSPFSELPSPTMPSATLSLLPSASLGGNPAASLTVPSSVSGLQSDFSSSITPSLTTPPIDSSLTITPVPTLSPSLPDLLSTAAPTSTPVLSPSVSSTLFLDPSNPSPSISQGEQVSPSATTTPTAIVVEATPTVTPDPIEEPVSTTTTTETSTTAQPAINTNNNCRCGVQSTNPNTGEQYHPWAAAIYIEDSLTCAGTLLNDRYVLALAECVNRTPARSLTLAFGLRSRNRIFHYVVRKMVQPGSNPNRLVLLRVKGRRVSYSHKARPICLLTQDSISTRQSAVAKQATISQIDEELIISDVIMRDGGCGDNKTLCSTGAAGQRGCEGVPGGALTTYAGGVSDQIIGVTKAVGCRKNREVATYIDIRGSLAWIYNSTQDASYCLRPKPITQFGKDDWENLEGEMGDEDQEPINFY